MTQTTQPTLGSGTHVYQWIDNWPQLPVGKEFGFTHGVAEDYQGRIIIFNTGPEPLMIFDADGSFISSAANQFIGGAHGLHLVDTDGNEQHLLVTDPKKNLIARITFEGQTVWQQSAPQESGLYPNPEDFKPTNIVTAPNGDIYVADGYGLSYVHRYTADGQYVSSWGGTGEEPGKMQCPHGVWVDTRFNPPRVLVADRANRRLQYFTLDGEFIEIVDHDLRYPCHFHQRRDDLLIPDLHGRITIFDKHNNLVTHLGDNPGIEKHDQYPNLPHDQREPGKFISPHMAAWDSAGNIFVAEWISDGRVTKLQRIE